MHAVGGPCNGVLRAVSPWRWLMLGLGAQPTCLFGTNLHHVPDNTHPINSLTCHIHG